MKYSLRHFLTPPRVRRIDSRIESHGNQRPTSDSPKSAIRLDREHDSHPRFASKYSLLNRRRLRPGTTLSISLRTKAISRRHTAGGHRRSDPLQTTGSKEIYSALSIGNPALPGNCSGSLVLHLTRDSRKAAEAAEFMDFRKKSARLCPDHKMCIRRRPVDPSWHLGTHRR